ncbi:hypothetical protein Leryth_017490, partial [Lithospermum erythrorhizon]
MYKRCLAALDTAEKSTGSGGRRGHSCSIHLSLSDLVSILERLLKVKAKRKIMKMPRNGDVQFTHANISYAQKELHYKPTTDLQTGLKKFVRWYLSYYRDGKMSDHFGLSTGVGLTLMPSALWKFNNVSEDVYGWFWRLKFSTDGRVVLM